jgi:hypothetical protein
MNRLRQREQSVLEQGREWTRRRLEPQWQAASDGLAAVCPQRGQGLRETRWRDLQLTTVVGGVKWHEVKSAVIYRLEQQVKKASGRGWLLEKDIVAWPPETAPVDFGAAVQAEARRRGLGRARYVYLVMDGAVWLWDLAADRFANAIKTLDSHQASQHLWAVGHALYGEGTASAKQWVQKLLQGLRHGQESRVVRRLEERLESPAPRPAEVQKVVAGEVNCIRNHRDHLHYQAVAKAGAPIGSGAVESLGVQLQERFRGGGQFWRRPGISHLLYLATLVRNQDDCHLWN